MGSAIRRYSTINAYLEASNATVRSNMDEFYIRKISELGNDSTEKMQAIQRDFYQINFLTSHDAGTYGINSRKFIQSQGQLYFISPDHVYSWERRSELDGYLVFFKSSLFNFQRPVFAEEFTNLFGMDSQNILSIDTEKFEEVKQNLSQLEMVYHGDNPMRTKILANALLSLIYFLKGLNMDLLYSKNSNGISDNLLFRYRNLIRNFFLQHKSVQFYAEKLHVTPNHLNAVCQKQLGKTAKSLIENQVIDEAKVQLLYGNDYLKEVSHYLGFKEQTNFSRFFKKHTGLTPEAFRLKEH